jgi:UDP-glucuronate decarboxylase
MMNTRDSFTGPVNIGNPNEFTINELAQKVISLVGASSKVVFNPLPADDPKQRQPSIALATQELNWQPSIQLDEGLAHTIKYFRELLNK